MDRQANDYAAAASAMAYAQQQRPGANMQQQQQFGFHPQHQQFPPPPFMPPHPSMQQFPYPPLLPQQPASQLHPHLLPHPQLLHQQQPHPSFSPHLPPHMLPSPFHALHDSPPPPAPPPNDPELQKRIDKLVEYAIKNGPEFEVMIREKQHDNPAYSFLFGGEGHNYYRYKLWLSTRASGSPFNPPFPPSSSMPMIHHPPNAMMNSAVGAAAPMVGTHPMHQPPFPPFYDAQHLHSQRPPAFGFLGRPDFDQSSKHFRSPLSPDVAMEITNVLNSLNGTKESIKGAKVWFMQRSAFAPALAESLKERVFALDDSERQLHIIYLANDILFDGLQRRMNLHELDNEAIALKPVLGSMLARIYHNTQNQEENQSRLQKILQFWASKEVFDQDTIHALENEMVGGPPAGSFTGSAKDLSSVSADLMAVTGFPQQTVGQNASQWQPDRQNIPDQDHLEKKTHPTVAASLGNQQFMPNSVSAGAFPGAVPMNASIQSVNQLPAPHLSQASPASIGEKLPPYPLFPPGLIPGMVRKMQIGSGVPYSPLSPLDIPTIIPPSDMAPTEILERVSKFFKEIGEINPSEGPMTSNAKDEYDEYDQEPAVRKGGACIPPPPNLQVDPETGAYPDGSVERKPGPNGSGRLGLGATADPNEPSQYDDVYTSYRKQRSTNYHSSMSARASAR